MAAPDRFTSPTTTVSPLGGSPRESSANGFTAVNPKAARISDDGSRREEPRRGNALEAQNGGGDLHRNGGGDSQRNGSPLGSSTKRKRSIDVDSDSDEDEEEEREYSRQPPDSWNGRPGDDQIETRVVEALGRENGHGSREGEHAPVRAYQQDDYSGMITTNAGVQMDPKKRKRVGYTLNRLFFPSAYCERAARYPNNEIRSLIPLQAFTNRTKTGCQTCRRRKKKCDEAKPECTIL
jgi:hypothetical protein